jgi:hypothetical protein
MKKLLASLIILIALTSNAQVGRASSAVQDIERSKKERGFWYLIRAIIMGSCSNCYGLAPKQQLPDHQGVYFLKKEETTYWM